MATKKFYAVAAGAQPGIYTSWPAAKAQVNGFAGARYKGFFSRKEAEAWLARPTVGTKGRQSARAPSVSPLVCEPKPGEVTIYTDGGSINNPGPGGYGIVRLVDGKQTEISGGFRHTTNNRMELMACIVALRQLAAGDLPITLYTDSRYVVNGISKGWAKGWRRRGWLKSDKTPALNPDLWAELLDLVEELNITFSWVKGHAGNPLNERCDALAVAAARQGGLPVDIFYERQQE